MHVTLRVKLIREFVVNENCTKVSEFAKTLLSWLLLEMPLLNISQESRALMLLEKSCKMNSEINSTV